MPRRFLKVIAGDDAKPFSDGAGRLELARAIVDPENPPTPRGSGSIGSGPRAGAGLVRVAQRFRRPRAEPPSHPELLDWLARKLMEEGWSTRAIHRLILLSSTYRQTSAGGGPTDAERG